MDILNKNIFEEAAFGEGDAKLVWENDYVRVTNRGERYSSLAVHADKTLGEKKAYKSTYSLRLPEGATPITVSIYHKITINYLDVTETNYVSCDAKTITSDEWTELELSSTIPLNSILLDYIVYFIQIKGEKQDILVNKFTVEETEPQAVDENDRARNYPPVSYQDKMLIGTIRWDAFTESDPNGMRPSDEVARVLSYKEYHNQAPFFTNVHENGRVSFPKYTMEIWEKEAEYAKRGGLDYYAYLWYDTEGPMSEPRKMHLKSAKKDTVLMCGVLEKIRSDATMSELYEAMKDSCYLRLDNRPVVYLYGLERWQNEEIKRLTDGALNAGITEPLYIVGMAVVEKAYSFIINYVKGIDAISWYSVGARKKDMTFEELKDSCEDSMLKGAMFSKGRNIDVIPSFTTGRDTRARIRTGVSWCAGDPKAENDRDKPYFNYYALPPTDKELEDHIRFTLDFVDSNKETCRSRLVCSYGWNEHEEGGWLCPTLKVDENYDVIRDKNGNILHDTTRIDILRKVIDSRK